MPTQFPGDIDSPHENNDAENIPPPIPDDILQWLEQLRRSDQSLYNLMALEVWSIAQTMDQAIPGFWNRFMENRQLALKAFLAHRQTQQQESSAAPVSQTDQPEPEPDGMMEGDA
ncbi:MAG: hypothetical protein NW220_17405 [Leptolyngbyaceae cyanobacterium bins.349]|nr:hypothetical protein [Leptolyngbyaceae cyanobacterium bins.349]